MNQYPILNEGPSLNIITLLVDVTAEHRGSDVSFVHGGAIMRQNLPLLVITETKSSLFILTNTKIDIKKSIHIYVLLHVYIFYI